MDVSGGARHKDLEGGGGEDLDPEALRGSVLAGVSKERGLSRRGVAVGANLAAAAASTQRRRMVPPGATAWGMPTWKSPRATLPTKTWPLKGPTTVPMGMRQKGLTRGLIQDNGQPYHDCPSSNKQNQEAVAHMKFYNVLDRP